MYNALSPSLNKGHLPSLTGIRFFAVIHIFFYHIWNVFATPKDPTYASLYSEVSFFPDILRNFFSNGWMSTSFFFILSGFLAAYLYWPPEGQKAFSKRRYWVSRFIRIYPVHLVVMVVTLILVGPVLSKSYDHIFLIESAIGSLVLVQSWIPAWVPIWNWPAWTISTLAFLYMCTPYLINWFSLFTRKQLIIWLCILPFVSLAPTLIYICFFPIGSEPSQSWQIFICNNPLFWIAQYSAGMLVARIFGFVRDKNEMIHLERGAVVSLGDFAILFTIAIACVPNISDPLKYILRHGLMMPLYMLIIVELARGNGVFARFFALRSVCVIGETGFSIFIWQNLVMIFCWRATYHNFYFSEQLVLVGTIALILVAFVSTYLFEKPVAAYLKRRLLY